MNGKERRGTKEGKGMDKGARGKKGIYEEGRNRKKEERKKKEE